jgi:DNA-binding transcriptional MerR regulator
MRTTLKISEAAEAARVNIQTLRYYERIGLLKPLARTDAGYRGYDGESVKRVQFIKRAQSLGFTLDDVRDLLAIRITPRAREATRKKAKEKLTVIREKISQLKSLERTLSGLVHDCELGKSTTLCPILAELEGSDS